MAPTFFLIDMSLSFSTTTSGVRRWPAWLSPSYAIPPVRAPSPMTATTRPPSGSSASRTASARPTPTLTDVLLCPVPKASCALSLRLGKPERPPWVRMVGNAFQTAGDELVRVGLVAHVPHDHVLGRIELGVERQREFDHPQTRAEMAAGTGDGGDDLLPDLAGEVGEPARVERAEIGGKVELFEEPHGIAKYRPRGVRPSGFDPMPGAAARPTDDLQLSLRPPRLPVRRRRLPAPR